MMLNFDDLLYRNDWILAVLLLRAPESAIFRSVGASGEPHTKEAAITCRARLSYFDLSQWTSTWIYSYGLALPIYWAMSFDNMFSPVLRTLSPAHTESRKRPLNISTQSPPIPFSHLQPHLYNNLSTCSNFWRCSLRLQHSFPIPFAHPHTPSLSKLRSTSMPQFWGGD